MESPAAADKDRRGARCRFARAFAGNHRLHGGIERARHECTRLLVDGQLARTFHQLRSFQQLVLRHPLDLRGVAAQQTVRHAGQHVVPDYRDAPFDARVS